MAQIAEVYNYYQLPTKIIAASIRHPAHVEGGAALAGAQIATLPYSVLTKMFVHPLTTIGLEQFARDWQKGG